MKNKKVKLMILVVLLVVVCTACALTMGLFSINAGTASRMILNGAFKSISIIKSHLASSHSSNG